ncbi:cation:proton antiporter subunit C [Maricaulis parjimensis]|uniref:cation:proton antiporter subunit C n=1 Tax=Maricaulis parjimensis TaxID=144023 RepID=UPI001939855B|nr:cation:proton antiporter subunit C [Maricaulis parjimensis]
MVEMLLERFNYIPIIILMMTGLYVVIATGNLVKRLVGLSLFQTSVFLLYITIGKVFGGQPPILADGHGDEGGHGADAGYGAAENAAHSADAAVSHAAEAAGDHGADYGVEHGADHAADAAHGVADAAGHAADVLYSNPLPHVLILTAIVVGVATLAVGLALVVRIREAYGTIEDDELNAADYSVETGGSA